MNKVNYKYLFFLYTFFSGFLFFMPVLLNIYLDRGIKVETVFLLEIVYYISIFIFEIPSGMLGDRYGHGKVVLVGLIGTFITYIFFAYAEGILQISIIQFFLGLFGCLVSGSDKVSFFSVLKTEFDKEQVYLMQKKANIIFVMANLLSFVIGGFLMSIDVSGKWVLISTGIGVFLSIFSFLPLLNLKNLSVSDDKTEELNKFSIKTFVKNKKLVSWCLVSGFLLAVLGNFYWIIQLYYDYLGLSSKIVGLLFMVSSLITILLGKLVLFNEGSNKGIVLLLIFPLTYFLMPVKSYWIVPIVILLYSIIKIELQPYLENTILELDKNQQSTHISITAWINNFLQVVLLLLYSSVFSFLPFRYAVILLGVLIFIIILISTRIIFNLRNTRV